MNFSSSKVLLTVLISILAVLSISQAASTGSSPLTCIVTGDSAGSQIVCIVPENTQETTNNKDTPEETDKETARWFKEHNLPEKEVSNSNNRWFTEPNTASEIQVTEKPPRWFYEYNSTD